jgi:hypothetical protein
MTSLAQQLPCPTGEKKEKKTELAIHTLTLIPSSKNGAFAHRQREKKLQGCTLKEKNVF